MSWHHYYDRDFLGHLHEVNPVLANKLHKMREAAELERARIANEYHAALKLALEENWAQIKIHLRPCHRKDVDAGKGLVIYPTLF